MTPRSVARTAALAVPLLAAALAPARAFAQGVLVAPTAVFIDARVRTAALLLVNPNDDPAEVEIGPLFGYPVTDSLGNIQLYTAERPDTTVEPSAAAWVKIFPRRFTIAPKANQAVRILVSPHPDAPDGEYWTRLVIVARGGKLPVTVVQDTTGGAAGATSEPLTVGLTMEVHTIIPLFYRKGKLDAALGLGGLRATPAGDSLAIRARLERRGNAAVLGTAHGDLVDSTGKVRASFTTPVAVYRTIEPYFAAPIAGLPAGRYRLRVEVAATRADLSPESVLKFRAVRDSMDVTLP